MKKYPNKFKCLTLSERVLIETGITNGATKREISHIVGKDETTIAKEIRLHRSKEYTHTLPLECSNYRHCTHGRLCSLDCKDYVKFVCKRRDISPGACNGCTNMHKCRFTKFKYHANIAHNEYAKTLVDSRTGFNISKDDANKILDIIKKPIQAGQSPYTVLTNHPEIKICEKTLYTYIEQGLFNDGDVTPCELRRFVSRKITKPRKNKYKPRNDKSFLKNRTYQDYLEYIKNFPDSNVVEMDTVYNQETGPFIQTFKFVKYGFLFAVLHESKFMENMVSGVDLLESILGLELFKKYVHVIVTDRGSEFYDASRIEVNVDGELRCKLFYCDPMCSHQKGSLENNHIELRYILPKHHDLYKLGLISQDKLNTVLSHVNSFSKEKFDGKSSIEFTEFLAPDLVARFKSFGIYQIPKDNVVLNNSILKK